MSDTGQTDSAMNICDICNAAITGAFYRHSFWPNAKMCKSCCEKAGKVYAGVAQLDGSAPCKGEYAGSSPATGSPTSPINYDYLRGFRDGVLETCK